MRTVLLMLPLAPALLGLALLVLTGPLPFRTGPDLPLKGETEPPPAQPTPPDADAYGMTAPTKAPRITAADLAAAATRLLGAVVLDVADRLVGPALYVPRLEAWQTIDGEDLGADDGTLVALVLPGEARDLINDHGTPGKAAAAVNKRLAAEYRAS